MAVLLGLALACAITLTWRPLWAGGGLGRTAWLMMALSGVAFALLLIVERVEAIGEYQ